MSSEEGSTISYRRAPASFGRAAVERFARTLESDVAKGRRFECLLTGDAELRRLNAAYRGKDYTTDVLSFPAAPLEISAHRARATRRPAAYLGDIAISLPRARAQARRYGHAFEDEVRILMLHGVLHLLGMDHENDSGRMARAERRWRQKLGLPQGLIERVES